MVGAVKGEMRSDCLLDLAAAEATGADADASGRPIDYCADTLKVGIECALGLVVGMTDVMARLVLF